MVQDITYPVGSAVLPIEGVSEGHLRRSLHIVSAIGLERFR